MGAALDGIETALDGPPGLAVLGVLLLLAIGWYLSYLAARLDALHHRVESSAAALEARLARRAASARETARLLGPDGDDLGTAAARALARGAPPQPPLPPVEGPRISEEHENDLSRVLHRAFGDPSEVAALRDDPVAADLLDDLVEACDLVQLARRFHNDAVAHTQRIRRKRVVRWARLAGRAAMPQMVEIDDSRPVGLGRDA